MGALTTSVVAVINIAVVGWFTLAKRHTDRAADTTSADRVGSH